MPLYKEVELRYGDSLAEEHRTKHERVAALENEARATTAAAAFEAVRHREQGERLAREAELAAEKRVQELEQERLRVLEAHHRQLREVQERMEDKRRAADQRMREVEEETQALYDQCEADIRRISAERDAATRAARERCAKAEQEGEEASRRAERDEREATLQARKAQADEERRRAGHVMEAEKRCEAWRKHCEEAVMETQRRVAERIEELLAESMNAKGSLERNRVVAGQHSQLQVKETRQATAKERADAECELEDARRQLRDARGKANAMTEEAVRECVVREREHVEEIHSVASGVEAYVRSLGKMEAYANPQYVRGLEELAMRLRTGQFTEPPPRPKPLQHPGTTVAELAASR